MGGAKKPAAHKASFTAALVSDIGKFTDKGFNQNQLKGLNDAKKKFGITALPLQSNSTSDYAPNFNTAIRKGAKLVIAAGFLLAGTRGDVREEVPERQLRDHGLHGAHLAVREQEGRRPADVREERRGPDVHGERGRAASSACSPPRGAEDGRQRGRRGRRHQDPAGRHLDRGLQVLRPEGRAGHEGASSSTRTTSSRPTSARRSPRTRSPRAPRCCSRWPAAAGSAR